MLSTIGVIILVLLVLIWPVKRYFFDKPPTPSAPQIVEIDPICQYVQKLHLNCVVTPVAESVLGPGHFVAYSHVQETHAKVPFANGDLLADACMVPGTRAAEMRAKMLAELKKQETTNNLPFDEITFKLDRAFQEGADLPVPRLGDLKLKAGPKVTEVQDISLKVPHGWLKIIDENQFINLLASAAILQRCIDRVIDKEYSVVSKAAIAQNYDIIVTEKAGKVFGLSAAVTKGEIAMDVGGDARSALDETIRKNSATPVVVGVDFFDSSIFKENRARLVTPIFSATAETKVSAGAMIPEGMLLWGVKGTGALGQPASIQHSGPPEPGYEQCHAGIEPSAILTSILVPAARSADRPESQSFELLTSGTIVGGVSAGWSDLNCKARARAGIIEADASFDSVVETIVRSDEASILQVEFAGLHVGSVDVRDSNGHLLAQKGSETEKTGSVFSFPISGAGVYEVRVSGNRPLSTDGPSRVTVKERGTFTVSVH
jgi:hypothetical protein